MQLSALSQGMETPHAQEWGPFSSWVPWGSLDESELEKTQDQKGGSQLRSGRVLVSAPGKVPLHDQKDRSQRKDSSWLSQA